jgi:hypothetical protein
MQLNLGIHDVAHISDQSEDYCLHCFIFDDNDDDDDNYQVNLFYTNQFFFTFTSFNILNAEELLSLTNEIHYSTRAPPLT